jgi:hypothetical protein
MRLRVLHGAAVGVAALATPASAVVPGADCHGVAFTDAAGDQYLVTSANTFVRPTAAIDIRDVFLTGSGLDEKVNITVGSLTAWNNTSYTFRWDDPAVDNLGGYFELQGDFFGTNTAGDQDGGALMTRHDINGTTIWLAGHGTARAFHGAVVGGVEGPGVIQLGVDQNMGVQLPTDLWGMEASASQYESNALTDLALRTDSAAAPSGTPWTQPC